MINANIIKINDEYDGLIITCANNEIKKTVHHITIVDNIILSKNLTLFPIYYPRAILNYSDHVNIASTWLITTYPNYEYCKYDITNIYHDFSKIIKNYYTGVVTAEHYQTIKEKLQIIIDIIISRNNNPIIEIVIITNKYNRYVNYNILDEMQSDVIKLKYIDVALMTNKINISKYLKDNFLEKIGQPKRLSINLINSTHNLIDAIQLYQINNAIIEGNTRAFLLNKQSYDDSQCTINYMDILYNSQIVTNYNNLEIVQYIENLIETINIDYLLNLKDAWILLEKDSFINEMIGLDKFNKNVQFMKRFIRQLYKNIKNNNLLRNLNWINADIKILDDIVKELLKVRYRYTISSDSHSNVSQIFNYYSTISNIIIPNKKHKNIMDDRIAQNEHILKFDDDIDKYLHSDNIKKFIETYDIVENDSYENIIDNKNESFMRSCEFFTSVVTLSNWYEEFKNKNSLGLLISVNTNDLCKLGISGINITITNITTSFIPIREYLEIMSNYFKNNEHIKFGNLNNCEIITGSAIGSGNVVIPLYINKYHWEISKKHSLPMLGMAIAHNPLGFTSGHLNFMFTLLIEMTYRTFKLDEKCFSEKWIHCYLALYRTCTETCIDKGFMRGISTLINNYLNSDIVRSATRPFENIVIMGQLMCTGCNIDNISLNKLIEYIYEETICISVEKEYGNDLFDFIFHEDNKDILQSEIEQMITYVHSNILVSIQTIISIYKMIGVLRNIYKEIGSFNQMLKTMDKNYGCLPDKYIEIFFKSIVKTPDGIENIDINYLYKIRNFQEVNECHHDVDGIILLYIFQAIKYPIRTRKKENKIVDIFNCSDKITVSWVIDRFKLLHPIIEEINDIIKIVFD